MTTDKTKNFFRVSAEDFKKIPGSPIAYWISENMGKIFSSSRTLNEISPVKKGIDTGENALFLREWHEVSNKKLSRLDSSKKWYFYVKGGEYRKWYGNISLVVNWENDGFEIRHHKSSTIRNQSFFKKQAITWSLTGTKGFAARYVPENCMFDNNGSSVFPNDDSISYIISYMNTNVVSEILKCLNPTIAFQVGDIANIPISQVTLKDETYKHCISIAKNDWDSYETSWDFQENPLIAEYQSGKWVKQTFLWDIYDVVRRSWTKKCEEMHQFEMANNRIFIDAYGLQNELSSDVPWNEITLTCNPWYRYSKSLNSSDISCDGELSVINGVNSLFECHSNGVVTSEPYLALSGNFPYNKDLERCLLEDTIKEFISYAVGCMMGRYSPEKPGLILANQSNGQEEDLIIYETTVTGSNIFSQDPSMVSFSAKNGQQLMSSYTSFFPVIGDNKHLIIDRDGVLPILDEEWFFDDIVTQFKAFVALTFGEENLSANMDFIESVLGKDIRKYFVKDFYKEHIQRYKKRPIYWLFSSPKGSFNALIYLHRYTPDTVSIVLNEYLRELMTKISTRIKHLIEENNRTDISNADKTRNLKQIDKYTAQLAELEDYERDVIFPLAQQKIAIDLDDGVKVNYCKFGTALKKIPGLEAKEE